MFFTDASEKAYGAVLYLCSESCNGVDVQQVLAKTCVAPIKEQTIPRLELMAAVLASDLYAKVSPRLAELLVVEKVFFWCDSKIVLHWVWEEILVKHLLEGGLIRSKKQRKM